MGVDYFFQIRLSEVFGDIYTLRTGDIDPTHFIGIFLLFHNGIINSGVLLFHVLKIKCLLIHADNVMI